jgi:hypothetical protein
VVQEKEIKRKQKKTHKRKEIKKDPARDRKQRDRHEELILGTAFHFLFIM